MSHSVTRSITRSARVPHSGRDGITVGHLRELLADCEAAGVPDTASVRFEDRLASEGGNRSGYVEASHRSHYEVDEEPS